MKNESAQITVICQQMNLKLCRNAVEQIRESAILFGYVDLLFENSHDVLGSPKPSLRLHFACEHNELSMKIRRDDPFLLGKERGLPALGRPRSTGVDVGILEYSMSQQDIAATINAFHKRPLGSRLSTNGRNSGCT